VRVQSDGDGAPHPGRHASYGRFMSWGEGETSGPAFSGRVRNRRS
jgi:hypothetical protein